MARAKNTSRAEARRRNRVALREDDAALEGGDELDTAAEPAAPQQRPSMFKMPNIREDIRALPGIFRSRRMLWVPLLLLAVGFGMVLAFPGLPEAVKAVGSIYIQFFFGVPQQYGPPLFTFFIAGFVAPRASYLVGALYGVLWGVLWTILILVAGTSLLAADPQVAPISLDPFGVLSSLVILGILWGTLAAAFAAWYRDFLRNMQVRGAARRAEQEAKAREKQREERRAARSVFKGRT